MLMERTAARNPRAGSPVPPWARLLWLGALLFGILYAHGLHADSSVGHTAPGSVSMTSVGHVHDRLQASADGHDTDGEPAHAAQDCATGQPPAAFDFLPPALSPLDSERALDETADNSAAAVRVPPVARSCPASAVLRI
ncbi:hypothetical protein AB0F25_09515 [Streptomyces wedmorensis]|uniref:hypothetical protein n=1 Tax=Streptomyces wedmorensis TaxID=43759 RepID=UPI00341246AF